MSAPRIVGAGTVALDTVETPWGRADDVPGGSALYFGAAARHFGRVALLGAAGADYPAAPLDALAAMGVDVTGVERCAAETLRWHVRYAHDGSRETVAANRGVGAGAPAAVPPSLRDPDALFLGSMHPAAQRAVLEGAGRPRVVALDTMAHWVRDEREALRALLGGVDVFVAGEDEVTALGGGTPTAAALAILSLGPDWVVVKRGARGALAVGRSVTLWAPAVPVERAMDPTGAGDAFAGGLVGTLAGAGELDEDAVARGLAAGTALAALAVRAFSFAGLLAAGAEEVRALAGTLVVRRDDPGATRRGAKPGGGKER